MNNDLISRNALLQSIGSYGISIDPYNITRLITQKVIAAPAVDAEPVKHGIWEPDPKRYICSVCHKWIELMFSNCLMNYCPHCGSRMDGGNKDE